MGEIDFEIRREDYREERVEDTYKLMLDLISDFDSSANLFVGGSSSVLSKLEESGADDEVLASLEEVEDILDEINVEDIEELHDIYTNYLKYETDDKDDLIQKSEEIKDVFSRALDVYTNGVYDKVDDTSSNNVGYAMSRLKKMASYSEDI